MRHSLSALLLVCFMSATALAGHIPIPPRLPPCTENCTGQATTSPILTEAILLLLTITTKR